MVPGTGESAVDRVTWIIKTSPLNKKFNVSTWFNVKSVQSTVNITRLKKSDTLECKSFVRARLLLVAMNLSEYLAKSLDLLYYNCSCRLAKCNELVNQQITKKNDELTNFYE